MKFWKFYFCVSVTTNVGKNTSNSLLLRHFVFFTVA